MLSGITKIYYRKEIREKTFYVLEYHTSKSVVTVQCAFLAKYSFHHCHVTSQT